MNKQETLSESAASQYVIFRLDNETYGISIHYVEIIEKVTNITRVPNAAPHIMGVINLRGEIVPVVNLRKLFNLQEKSITEDSRIIILSVDDIAAGLMTDSSSEVLTIQPDNIENVTSVLSDVDETAVKGIGKVDGRIIILLDIQHIMGLKGQEKREGSPEH